MNEHSHPSSGVYLRVAAVLVPVLLFLSAVKFTLVVMFYMHLKFDNRFFAFLFGGPLLLGVAVVVSLLFIFYGALRLRTGT